MDRIASTTNARVKEATRLARTAERRAAGLALLEGWHLVEEAVRSGVALAEVFLADDDAARARCAALGPAGSGPGGALPVHLVTPPVLARVATTESPQPIVATFAPAPAPAPAALLARLAAPPPPFVAALWEAADPGNLGTVVRTAEAAGAAGVATLGASADPWNPKALRASAGALLRLAPAAVEEGESVAFLRAAAGTGAIVAALVAGADHDFYDLDLRARPVVLLLGNEAHGLPPELAGAATHRVALPQAGPTESLNLAAAAAAALFEVLRQRRRAR